MSNKRGEVLIDQIIEARTIAIDWNLVGGRGDRGPAKSSYGQDARYKAGKSEHGRP